MNKQTKSQATMQRYIPDHEFYLSESEWEQQENDKKRSQKDISDAAWFTIVFMSLLIFVVACFLAP